MANPQIIDKSIGIALDVLPKVYDHTRNKKFFHFTFVYKKNKLLAIGQNYPDKQDNKVVYFARRYNIKHWLDYPFTHSELDAVSKLWGRYHIDNTLKFVVLRLNRYGQLRQSKPCRNCQTVLKALDVNKVWWSNKNEGFSYGLG